MRRAAEWVRLAAWSVLFVGLALVLPVVRAAAWWTLERERRRVARERAR